MSLVAYASSGSESSDNEDDSTSENGIVNVASHKNTNNAQKLQSESGENSNKKYATDQEKNTSNSGSTIVNIETEVTRPSPLTNGELGENNSEHESPQTVKKDTDSKFTDDEEKYSDSDEDGGSSHGAVPITKPTVQMDTTELLNNLPDPVNQAEKEVNLDDDVLEEEVKPKQSQVSDVPKPPPKKAKVKITIPSLQQDSDEETDNDKPKRPSSTKSGLMSMLPPPSHAASSGRIQIPEKFMKKSNTETSDNITTESSTQDTAITSTTTAKNVFIPHILTKKPASQKPTTVKKHAQSSDKNTVSDQSKTLPSLTAYDADSDEEGTAESSNFFSLGSEKNSVHSTTEPPSSDLTDIIVPSDNSVICDGTVPSASVDQDAPLLFGGSSSSSSSYSYLRSNSQPFSAPVYDNADLSEREADVGPSQKEEEDEGVEGVAQGAEYPEYEQQYCELPGPDSTATLLQDEEFLKIRGKKRKGGFEDINIVDVSCDDIVNPSDLSKNLTEEVEYQSHRKGDNMPSAQQRRKKQITYLAFQAKEQELSLKNEWAQNRQTKKHAQSKYGF